MMNDKPTIYTSAEQIAKELRAGMEGVTLGPWKQHLVDDTTVISTRRARTDEICHTTPEGYGIDADVDFHTDTEQCERNAAHIARCSPDHLTILLDEFEARGREIAHAHELLIRANDARQLLSDELVSFSAQLRASRSACDALRARLEKQDG